VFKKNLEIYFKNIGETGSGTFSKVALELDVGAITQLQATYQFKVLQFLYTQASPLQHHVFTWDLGANCECQMHTFPASAVMPYVHLSRGVTPRENYFVPMNAEHVFDLRFSFPLNVF
jgi:hypothetical protein